MTLLDEVMVDELVELEEETMDIALNLESNNVGDTTQSNKINSLTLPMRKIERKFSLS